MSQFMWPISDITNEFAAGGWDDLNDGGTPNDSDYGYTANNGAQTFEALLTDLSASEPVDGTCTVKVRHAQSDDTPSLTIPSSGGSATTFTIAIYEGATLRAGPTSDITANESSWLTDSSLTFNASVVVDWSDLRIRLEIDGGGGSPTNRRGMGVSWVEIETPDTGGTTFEQSVAGSLTPAGTVSKEAQVTVEGGATPAGAITKETQTSRVSGGVTPTGAITKETQTSRVSGGVTPTGALATLIIFLKSIAGSLTPVGTITKETQKVVSGSVTPAGDITKETQKGVAGSVVPTADITKSTLKNTAGGVTPTGALTTSLLFSQAVAGVVACAGALATLFIAAGEEGVKIYRRLMTVISTLGRR